ncbi:MAG: ankyrin repeat domain-containing protein [Anaeromyxobacter sp.]
MVALAEAASVGDVGMVRSLLAQGVPVDARGNNGKTPLYFAVRANSRAGVAVLLEAGASPNVRIESPVWVGGVPLVFSAALAGPEMLELLLQNGANPNVRKPPFLEHIKECPFERETLLLECINDPVLVALLVRFGADVNVRPERTYGTIGGVTAAERAAILRRYDVVKILLDAGVADLEGVANALQVVPAPADMESDRIQLLSRLRALGATIRPSEINPRTPSELVTPGAPPLSSPKGPRPWVCGPAKRFGEE